MCNNIARCLLRTEREVVKEGKRQRERECGALGISSVTETRLIITVGVRVCVRERDLRYDKMKNVINFSTVLSLALESYTSVIPNCLS